MKFLSSLLTTILAIFILVYIKQNVRKKSNIILFNSLVVVATSITLLINLIYKIDYGEMFINFFVCKIIEHIIKILVIFSLIYFTSNMKNLDKISSIFISYIICSLVCMVVLPVVLYSKMFEFSIAQAIGAILNVAIVMIIYFIGYCLTISLAFKILSRKNEDILIDNEEDENIEDTER